MLYRHLLLAVSVEAIDGILQLVLVVPVDARQSAGGERLPGAALEGVVSLQDKMTLL